MSEPIAVNPMSKVFSVIADLEHQLREAREEAEAAIAGRAPKYAAYSSVVTERDEAQAQLRESEAAREGMRAALRRFLGLHPFTREVGVCISCGGKATDYPGEIHYPNCLWVQIGNDAALSSPSGLLDALKQGREVLGQVEWRGARWQCPRCDMSRSNGHAHYCLLAAALKALEPYIGGRDVRD